MSWKNLRHFHVHPLPVVRKMAFTSISCMHGRESRPSSDSPSKATGIPRPWHQQSRASPFFAEKLPISPVSSPSSAVYKSSTSLLNNLVYTMLFYRQGPTSINTLTQSATHSLIGSTERNPGFHVTVGLDRQAGLLAAIGYN